MKYLIHLSTVVASASLLIAPPTHAQQRPESKSTLRFDHFRDMPTLVAESKALAAAHPDLLTYAEIGTSSQGRPIFVLTLNNPKTGPDTSKPAMYIDGNIHGNEIQASETVLYTVWYLVEQYGENKAITELLDRVAFYFVPSVNPDGRQVWFEAQNSPHSSRTGMKPTDNDRDGTADEDGPDDLDGYGSIGMMWRRDPNGTHRRSELDPNEMEFVAPAPRADGTIHRGDWSMAGKESIDNDGDGEINEDGPGGYDMNRNWPGDWQPDHVQGGAGAWPLAYPETDAIARFILSKPNIAAGQAYHNAGGMILRGPGAKSNEGAYAGDISTYDAIANVGAEMLPGYRSMVIWSDLYPVRGGFVNWLSETLGIVSFTNELWTEKRILESGGDPSSDQRERFNDRALFGETRTPLTETVHPTLGTILVGGSNKWSSRIPPSWMLEEECHRNAAFTIFHASEMPRLSFGEPAVRDLGGGLFVVTIEIKNDALIPTRTNRAAQTRSGLPDRLMFHGAPGVKIASIGAVSNRFDTTLDGTQVDGDRFTLESGIPGRGSRFVRFYATGKLGDVIEIDVLAQKARALKGSVALTPTKAPETSAPKTTHTGTP
ncbi:MAG: M14 family metallopeptidase [bacterium]